jgi:hypothetical protein
MTGNTFRSRRYRLFLLASSRMSILNFPALLALQSVAVDFLIRLLRTAKAN